MNQIKDRDRDYFQLWLLLLFVLICFQMIFLSIGKSSRDLFISMEQQSIVRDLPLYTDLVLSPYFPWTTTGIGIALLLLCFAKWRSATAAARSCAFMFVMSILVLVGLRAPLKEISIPTSNLPAEMLLAPKISSQDTSGYRIMRVLPLSRIERAGLKPGDVLVSINGKLPQNAHDARSEFMSGSKLEVEIERAGNRQSFTIPERTN